MQSQLFLSANRWTTRDFVTLAIFNVVLIVILIASTMVTMVALTPSGNSIGGAGFNALCTGSVYLVMANKINKRGVLFYTAVITGLFFLIIGQIYYLIVMVALGLVCELLMWGKDAYRSTFRNMIGYATFYVSYSLCGVLPLIMFREQYVASMSKLYSAEQLDVMVRDYGTPGSVVLMCLISIAGAVAGCLLGTLFLRKHIRKAKLV